MYYNVISVIKAKGKSFDEFETNVLVCRVDVNIIHDVIDVLSAMIFCFSHKTECTSWNHPYYQKILEELGK